MAGYNFPDSDPSGYLGQAIGTPVKITSGLRSPQHNAAVGGVPNSAHLTGNAFDFIPNGVSTADATNRLVKSGIPFDQVYDEGDHVHVSFAPTNRRQVLKPKMAQSGPSDDDLLKALTGQGSPSPQAASPIQHGGPTDDQLLAALTGGARGASVSGGSSKPPAKSGMFMGKPFGFTEEVESHIPFSKDVAAGVPAGLDALIGRGSFGANYRQNLTNYNAAQQEYEANNPGLSTLGSGLGILASGGPTQGAASAIPQTLGQLIKSGAKGGAILGGLFGAGTPATANDGLDQRAGNAALGAATGSIAGAVLPVAGATIGRLGQTIGKSVNRLFPDAVTSAANKAKSIIEGFAGGEVTPKAQEIVPGSKPTLAEASGNTGVAALTRALRDLNPNSPLVTREAENAGARSAHLETATGTPEEVEAAVKARDAVAKTQRGTIFSKTQAPADIAPVRQTIDEILSGSSGARPAVKSALKDVSSILDNDGKPITDPKTLYDSVRKGIDDLISGKDLTKGYGAQAARELITVKDKLDDVIESAAPGFKQYLDDYAKASAPIASMKFLQGLNLTDAKGNLTLSKVQNAIKRLQAQQSAPGLGKGAKAVTTTQQQALESIRDDLLRADTINQGKSLGSNTVQNALAQNRLGLAQRIIPEGLGATAGAGLGHLVAGPYGAEVGGLIGDRLGAAIGATRAARHAQSQNMLQSTLEDMLLNPGRYQNPHQGIPSQIRPLNEILNGRAAQAAIAAANRLAIAHQVRPKENR